jgi:non-canonical poly(A) RNA polymerase PAPD5/7
MRLILNSLHKEVIDFYNWVKPQEYEREVRADVVKRLHLAFNRIEPGELKSFGSYAAGLYLPIGDMDLVYFTRKHRPGMKVRGGLPPKPARVLLNRFASFLREQGIAQRGTVFVIGGAKVPIIKFVDDRSGLKVDLCFDNDSGVTANDTFLEWKAAHPVMPIIVSVIKQFLMIRGLNDVATGGLGGFSIICLVTSLLQHMPRTGSTPNVGEILLEFFNLYGNIFDREKVCIRLEPPAYIDKVCSLSQP